MQDHPPARSVPEGVLLRPMRLSDVEAAERLTALALAQSDGRPPTREPARAAAWRARTAALLDSDPGGCWVADREGELVGVATSLRRETLWALSSYAVRPDLQGRGLGRLLLDATGTYAAGALRWMLSSTSDPRAVRRYRAAGFDVHPSMVLEGRVEPADMARPRRVRDGLPGDTEWMDSLDRGLRGAGRGDDHRLLARLHRLRVVDRPHRRGYAYLADDATVVLLAASDRRTAADLLTDALLGASGTEVRQRQVSPANQWALDVGLALGLHVRTEGYLCVRGLKPPTPYLHHPTLL